MYTIHVHILVYTALTEATKEYSESLGSGKNDKVKYRLGWKVDDLSRLNGEGRKLSVEVSTLIQKVQDPGLDLIAANIRELLMYERFFLHSLLHSQNILEQQPLIYSSS